MVFIDLIFAWNKHPNRHYVYHTLYAPPVHFLFTTPTMLKRVKYTLCHILRSCKIVFFFFLENFSNKVFFFSFPLPPSQNMPWLSLSSVPPNGTLSSSSSLSLSNVITRHPLHSLLLSHGGTNHIAETPSRLLWIQAVLTPSFLRTTQIMTPTLSVLTVRGQCAQWHPSKPML